MIADPKLIEIAKRNMKNIVPLYYEMGKAKAQEITKSNIYNSLTKAFKFNNIGKFSNLLTNMWDEECPDLELIAQVTALNNFTIDAAKTLLVPNVPEEIKENLKRYNRKMPCFFQFAKDKDESDVRPYTNSVVNRICRNIENIKQQKYNFNSLGKFNKNLLMNNHKIEIDNGVIEKYKELERERGERVALSKITLGDTTDTSIIKIIKDEFEFYLSEMNISLIDGIDMITKYIYTTNRNSRKGFLFDLFGDIIYENLRRNIKEPLGEYIMCEVCGIRVKLETPNSKRKYCEKCAKRVDNAQRSERRRLSVSEM